MQQTLFTIEEATVILNLLIVSYFHYMQHVHHKIIILRSLVPILCSTYLVWRIRVTVLNEMVTTSLVAAVYKVKTYK